MRPFSSSPVTKKNPPARAREPENPLSGSVTSSTMEDQGAGRVTGIRHIVRLKELLNKWQLATLISKRNNTNNDTNSDNDNNDDHAPLARGAPPGLSTRLRSAASDFEEDGCPTPEPPPDVPKGYLAVYVGQENRRFIIPTSYLSHNLFKILLEKVEEEYGFDHAGALTIPCETETFKYLLKCIETHPEEAEGVDHDHEANADF